MMSTPIAIRRTATFALVISLGAAEPPFDLLIRGGHVIDPRNRINAVMDVAVASGKIAAVAKRIAPESARRVVNGSGLYVTPGLIDIHVHVFAGTNDPDYTGALGVRADGFTFRNGVTTVVDAGSSGWRNFPEFKRQTIDTARTRVLAMLNIVGKGMGGRMTVEQDTSDMNPKLTADTCTRFKDHIVGIKIAHYAGPEWIAVDRAVEAGTLANIPVMVDFAEFRRERPFPQLVLEKLRPGDIYTHLYLGAVPMLDDSGRVLPYLFEARKRGVLFDVGHGGGSFLFRQAVPAVRQGFTPDSISTDLHEGSMNAGMKGMLNVLSKFLNMGMSLEDVIGRSTWKPAQIIHRPDLGHLSIGAEADLSVLRLTTGDFGFIDSSGKRMKGTRSLVAELTLRAGKVVWDMNGLAADDWDVSVRQTQSINAVQ